MQERRCSWLVFAAITGLSCVISVAARAEELVSESIVTNDRRPFPYSGDRLRDYLRGRRAPRSEPVLEEAPKRWDRALPFLAQRVLDLGYELPKPYGFGVIYATVDQDQDLRDLKFRLGNGTEMDIDFIEFGQVKTDSQAYQLRLDAWILPFMNVYALIGKVDGDSDVPFAVQADDALKILLPPVGALCDAPPPSRPEFCDEVLSAVVDVDYDGDSWGVGTVLAGGWSDYFASLSLNYVVTDIDSVDEDSTTWDSSVRVGYLGESGIVDYAVFVGVNYLKADTDLVGTASYDLTGVDPIDRVLNVEYEIFQGNAEATNYFLGANLDVSRSWHLTGQYGFGGSRDQLLLNLSRRF